MFKFFSIVCWGGLILWFMHFDADAYHERRMAAAEAQEQETIKEEIVKNSGDLIFPLADQTLADVISGYGDPRDGGKRTHEGIDIPAERGTPVLAVADGVVTKVGNRSNAGKQVWVSVGEYEFFYAHLDSWVVDEGQKVRQGDIVGTVGNTGNARHASPHLHFGVYVGRGKTIDPTPLFR